MGVKFSGAGGRYRLGQNSDINVTPFVDVMLVLLIIFMVALPAPTTSIPLNLPPARTPEGEVAPPTVVSVEAGGIFIGESASSLETLPKDLARIIAKPKPTNERIYLRAGRTVRYSRFMEIISRLRATGYAQIALINEEL